LKLGDLLRREMDKEDSGCVSKEELLTFFNNYLLDCSCSS
jgi:hypothetical protein